MGWATPYVEQLKSGQTVSFRPRGHSMRGRMLCTVAPLADETLPKKGDIVLCKVRGSQYLHLVKGVRGQQFLIGNNVGGANGWITRKAIFGILTSVDD